MSVRDLMIYSMRQKCVILAHFEDARCYCGGKCRRTKAPKCTKAAVNTATLLSTFAAVNAAALSAEKCTKAAVNTVTLILHYCGGKYRRTNGRGLLKRR